MRRSYVYRLYPTKTQATALASQLETLRRVYNECLAERKDAWELYGASTSKFQQVKRYQVRRGLDVTAAEGSRWLAHVAAVPVRDTIMRLDKAFQNYFRRVKGGEKAGYPRFKGAGRFDSIPFDNYPDGGCRLSPRSGGKAVAGDMPPDADRNGYRLAVFGAGGVRVRLHRPVCGKIKTAAVVRRADKWYVAFSCDLGEVNIPPATGTAVGIDVGIESFATVSDGTTDAHVPNPRFLQHALPQLRRAQRAASRKYKQGRAKPGQSKRWMKSLTRVAKLHERLRQQRREHAYTVSHDLTKKHRVICVETLNIRGMLRNHKLARHISDAAWGGFLNVLKHKAEKAGVRVVEVDARGTSQECSGCGERVAKALSVRVHACPHCSLTLHRDTNAARNILYRGCPELRKPARTGPAGDKRGVSPVCPGSSLVVRSVPPREGASAKRSRKGTRSRAMSQPSLFPDDA